MKLHGSFKIKPDFFSRAARPGVGRSSSPFSQKLL